MSFRLLIDHSWSIPKRILEDWATRKLLDEEEGEGGGEGGSSSYQFRIDKVGIGWIQSSLQQIVQQSRCNVEFSDSYSFITHIVEFDVIWTKFDEIRREFDGDVAPLWIQCEFQSLNDLTDTCWLWSNYPMKSLNSWEDTRMLAEFW